MYSPEGKGKLLPRVKSKYFPAAQLDLKSFRWYRNEHLLLDGRFQIKDLKPDGSFILLAYHFGPDMEAPEGQPAQPRQSAEALDQNTVDLIEGIGTSAFLKGSDFVIFEQSPKFRELLLAV